MIKTVLKMVKGSSANDSESTSAFRVAIPSWGFAGIRITEDIEPFEVLTRDEIETIFGQDLYRKVKSEKMKRYTVQECEEIQTISSLRRALYAPDTVMVA